MRTNPKTPAKTPIKAVASASAAAPRQPDDPGVQKSPAAKKPGVAARPAARSAQPKR
jgi:hypothetical protein